MIKFEIGKGYEQEKIIIDRHEDILVIGKNGGSLDLEIILEKEGASANIYGIIIGKDAHSYNIKTTSSHMVPNTKSRVHIKGVFMDSSNMNFFGMINIGKIAQLSDAYLKNDNLMIGDNCKVNSSPQLEIKADDVKASHGVTISTIDNEHMYYLMSRGISDKKSRDLLVTGFINDIFQKFPDIKL
ncbi:hypothetical protein A2713_01140 [candidate division WWE3 bacterium RIFCSPHIGHO2_01_FULL_35_17]|uniref:SUF system FeS cluster assembly SufBD core domain-containing protein n=1 Tax=candidate division WWE3 bacterium RIFCSPHIGHO2_01_FULL_35_17 TaxID=1802614 RepID=A0A1F4US23_UNCKA|nr:MAG: hypothetical protein A2713_01140 [candidate division WWE3 bacterium RIFCSPHIGHO2_01_FULL_35_17]